MEAVLLSSPPFTLITVKRKRFRQFTSDNRNRNRNLKGRYEGFVNTTKASNSNSLSRLVSGRKTLDKKSKTLSADNSTLPALLLHYAARGSLSKALGIWDEMINSSFMPNAQLVSQLIFIFGCTQDFDAVAKILRQMELKDSKLLPDIFTLSVSHFGKNGHLECMEIMIKKMYSMGYSIDSVTGNAYVLYHSLFGSLADTEAAYGRLKKSRILIEEEAIRAFALAYIKKNKFYELGCFVQEVGLGRRNVGNLLWNLLILSYAANFKMKSLQREFVRMVESGFNPDLNTFNIRSVAFSRMSLLWDLHLSIEHMKHEAVFPDIVTYGCVVDAYMDKRLGRNLEFALNEFNSNDSVSISTDSLVFEAMGKGDFHSSSEVVMEYVKRNDWTYKMLISVYLKKKFRSNQIFWNY
ncbi:hypothetical protein ACP275_10G070000 [Erythranthe tilingii]